MYKSRLFYTIIAILFFVYWFVLFPLLWVYLKPVIADEMQFDQPFWIPSLFWCGALLIFVILLLIAWWCMWCVKRKPPKIPDNSNGKLDSATIHNGTNKNVKDRVQMSELKLKCKSDAETRPDTQNALRTDKVASRPTMATQTSQTSDVFGDNTLSSPSSPKDFEALRSCRRLSSCYSCSKSIPDDDMVNIFLNGLWSDSETNDVKFEVVGKSVNQAKRFQVNDAEDIASSMGEKSGESGEKSPGIIAVPVRRSERMKSEIFIMINDDSTVQVENNTGDDVVFK